MNTTTAIAIAAALVGGAYWYRRKGGAGVVSFFSPNGPDDKVPVDGGGGSSLGKQLATCGAIAAANVKLGVACGGVVLGKAAWDDSVGESCADVVYVRQAGYKTFFGPPTEADYGSAACTNRPSGYDGVCCDPDSESPAIMGREEWQHVCSLPRRRCR